MADTSKATYKVKPGDCLWKIAESECGDGALWEEIAKANKLSQPYRIIGGMCLVLPKVPTKTPSQIAIKAAQSSDKGRSMSTTVSQSASITDPLSPALYTARPVAFPAFKFDLKALRESKIEIITPAYDYSLELKGEITLQRKGFLENLEFSDEGVKSKYKVEAAQALTKMTWNGQVMFDPRTKTVELKCDLAIASKYQGQVFATSSFEVIPPSTLRYTYEPREVEGSHGDFSFKGSFGYVVDITPRYPAPPVRVHLPEPVQVGKWVAVGLLVGAGVIVVGTLVEDVILPPGGFLDDPISFSAAAAMVRRAALAF